MRVRTYSELILHSSFDDRFRYLMLRGEVGEATFGHDRWMNQSFYKSYEWRQIRNDIILRDEGCDLGVRGLEIHDRVYIHHMNPMRRRNLAEQDLANLDPEYLICVSHRTHNAIHYGDESILNTWTPRTQGDTKPW